MSLLSKQKPENGVAAISAKKARPVTSSYAYQRVEQDLRARIQDGRLPAGTMLASRHNLAREYGVSLSTAQQAVANLLADGTLEVSDRRGTFVARTSDTVPDIADARSVAPPAENKSGSATRSKVGTLGIVSTARIDVSVGDTGTIWARQAIRSLESVFAMVGGTSRFFDRYPEHLGPYERGVDDANAIPMGDAVCCLIESGAEALAIVGLCDGRDLTSEIVAAVDIEQIPIVYISWHEIRPPLALVYYDNKYAGYQAAQHLIRKGYTHLFALHPFQEGWLDERIGGAQDAVLHAGIPEARLDVFPADPPYGVYDRDRAGDWAYETAKRLLETQAVMDAGRFGIIAPNDLAAYSVLRAAREHGLAMGADYGLVGFDDDPEAYSLGITTVRPPIEEMGEEAAYTLLRALRGERGNLQVRLRAQVIARASTDLPGRQSK